MIWFYSDPHFGHKNVIKYDNRPFKNADEMTKKMMAMYNQLVGPEDTVIFLGDVSFYGRSLTTEILKELHGIKILVRGNHDKTASYMMKLGFVWVCENMTIKIAGQRVRVCHYPYKPTWWERVIKKLDSRKMNCRIKDDGTWLLHGHVHNNWKWGKLKNKQINLSCCMWDYKPVSLTQVERIIQRGKLDNEE